MKIECVGCGRGIEIATRERITLTCQTCGGINFVSKDGDIIATCIECGKEITIAKKRGESIVHPKCGSKVFILRRGGERVDCEIKSDNGVRVGNGYLQRDKFVSRSGMVKVAWVQDMEKMGGAELSNVTCVKVGEKLGFDIVGVTPERFLWDILTTADVLVLNNFFRFSKEQWLGVMDVIRSFGKRYIKYEHDYREIVKRDRYNAWRIFHKAGRCIFISPAHMNDHLKVLGLRSVDDGGTAVALPLAIDTELFRPVEWVERRENVWINTSGKFVDKCEFEYLSLLDKYPDAKFEALADGVREFDPRVRAIDMVSHEELPALYSSADGLFHLPDQEKWAGERIVFEAALCGIGKFALNNNVGHRSWGENRLSDSEGLREWLRQSVYDFWKIVEEVVNE